MYLLCFCTSVNFVMEICICTQAEIELVTATIFQAGGRSGISARAEIHHVIRIFSLAKRAEKPI